MDLRHLTDKVLLLDTKVLAGREREISIKVLHHLKEIERRRLYSDLGFSSLFAYCLKELGYSESAATRRIQAARILGDLPQIEKRIENGSLSLSNLGLLNKFFKENEVESKSQKLEVIGKIENLSSKECEKELFRMSGKTEPVIKDKERRISENSVRVSLTLSNQTVEALEEARGLLNIHLTMDQLILRISQKVISLLKKDKFKLNRLKKSQPISNVNRVIPASIKKQVYLRDKKCTKCGSIHRLNYDHRFPFALGGNSTEDNIRLLCFGCNQRARIRARL